ncbi:tetratricopeptide repeat protein [Kribbella sp. DT2]|uniref:tetratricopeptide repeat protein n=1 Tax=Kribbella sp. DT2 TaxID=3393427 RepID=UPI003CEDE0B1
MGRTGTTAPPEPTGVRTADELVLRLRALRSWAGVSYHEIHRRVTASRRRRGVNELPAYNTVYRCLQPGRSRLDVELVVDIAAALLDDESHVAAWRQAHQVVGGRAADAGIVTVADSLPADPDGFVGREAEVAEVLAAYRAGATTVVIGGMAGVGKTQLARHLGHRLVAAGHGTDLQLAVDLRGFDPARPPADPEAVLEGFLRRLGVPGSQVLGLDLSSRIRRFRQLVAERNVLVLLDNAASEDQLHPLLAPGCPTLVTSRYQLDGGTNARGLAIGVFSESESLQLLRRTAGSAAVDADEATALRIAELVGHLPLALAVVAGRIDDLPGWSLADHLERLTEHRDRLRLEDSVGPALALSYEALPPERRWLLRVLALHPGRDFDGYAAAAAAGLDRAEVELELAQLVRASLIQSSEPGRFGLHDLVRLFAHDRSRDEDRGAARRDALTRFVGFYAAGVLRAGGTYAPHEVIQWNFGQLTDAELPPVAGRDEARSWFDAERANLAAVTRAAAEAGLAEPVTAVSTAAHYYLDTSGSFTEAEVIHRLAVTTAQDDRARSLALNKLGCVHWRLGRYAEGRDCYQQALELVRRIGNRVGIGLCLGNVALGHYRLGRYQDSVDCYRQALALLDDEDVLSPSASTHRGGLGWGLLRLGLVNQALTEFEVGLAKARRLGENTCEEAYALLNLGAGHERLGDLEQASAYAERSLTLSRKVEFRSNEADGLNLLGRIRLAQGDADAAVHLHAEALDVVLEIGHRSLAVEVRNDLGTALTSTARLDEATEAHTQAMADAETMDDRYELARAWRGLGDVLASRGDTAAARDRHTQARNLFTDLETPVRSNNT